MNKKQKVQLSVGGFFRARLASVERGEHEV